MDFGPIDYEKKGEICIDCTMLGLNSSNGQQWCSINTNPERTKLMRQICILAGSKISLSINGFASRHQHLNHNVVLRGIFTSIMWYFLLIILSKFMYLLLLIIPFFCIPRFPENTINPLIHNRGFCPILCHMGIMLNYHCKNLILNLNFNFGVD